MNLRFATGNLLLFVPFLTIKRKEKVADFPVLSVESSIFTGVEQFGVLEWFGVEREAAGMTISTSGSDTSVLSPERVEHPLQIMDYVFS